MDVKFMICVVFVIFVYGAAKTGKKTVLQTR